MKNLFAVVILLFQVGSASAQADLKKLDAYYSKALREWNIPGMSIAIVKDGRVVFSKGYGVLEVGKSGKPDAHTTYAIASNTKAFTATALALLVDQGKISWDDKVRKYLPGFALYDPYVSAQTTIRDLLCHRVGLGTFSGDIIWYRSALKADEILERVQHLPQAYGFRAGYGYSNVMYIAAGEVIERVSGKSWADFMKDNFFKPLSMARSVTSLSALRSNGNYATPHRIEEGNHVPMPWESWEEIAPMGGIISSVHDMAQWMIFNLNNGIWKGDTLLSAASRNILWTPHNTFTVDHTKPDVNTNFRGYALGWGVSDYHGRFRAGHSGGYSGMISGVTLVPEEKLGVVVLTNGMKSIYASLIDYTVDAFLGLPEKDHSALALERAKTNVDGRIEQRKRARLTETKPDLPLDQFAGDYFTPAYGNIKVGLSGNNLSIDFEHTPDLSAGLEHWHENVFQLKWKNPDVLPWFSFGTVKFVLDNNAKVKAIEFDVPNDDFWFEELNAKRSK